MAQHNLKRADEERASGLRSALRVISGARASEPGESGVRSMCPFCGSRDPSPEAPCCSEWNVSIWTEEGAAEPAAPVSRWQQVGAQIEKLASLRERLSGVRLSGASQLLVTLLASSIAALVVSLTTQSRVATDHTMISVPKAPTSADGSMPKDALLTLSAGPASVPSNHASELSQAAAAPASVVAAEGPAAVTPEAAPAPAAPAAAPEPVAVALAPHPAEAPPPPAAVAAPPAPAPAPVEPPPPVASASDDRPTEAVSEPPAKPQVVKRPPAKAAKVVTAHAPSPSRVIPAPPAESAARPGAAPRPEEGTESESPVVTALIPDRDVARRANEEASVPWREEKGAAEASHKTDSWVALRRGMSPIMVRRLLGEPKWKRHLVDTEVWLYQENSLFSDGWVAFSETEGGVLGWRHP